MSTPDTDTLTALKLLANGRDPAFVADATGTSADWVRSIQNTYGPERERLQTAVEELTHANAPVIPIRTPEPSRPPLTPAANRPRPALPAAGGTPHVTTPRPRPTPPDDITVEALVRACRRSALKRTQKLGPKLAALTDQITTALRDERAAAEAKAARAAEVAAAQAEVKRLEEALAEARAKAVAAGAPGGVRGGPRPCPECGNQFASPQALGVHRRHKHGIRSATPKTRSSA